jgi:dihydropyrimidine dehydrogenase (NAD+) subunit PreA
MDLSTKLAGIKMRSPFGVSPHNLDKPWFPGKKAAELYRRYVDAGAGYIYLPAIVPGEPTVAEKELDFETLFKNQQYAVRWLKIKDNHGSVIGQVHTAKNLFNFLSWADELVRHLKPYLPKDVPIIGQMLVHDTDPAKWAEHVKNIESLGVDLIELNTGCPVGMMSQIDGRNLPPEAKWGMSMGAAPEFLFPVLEAVTENTSLPVGFKLTPEAGYPRMMYIVDEASKRGMKYVVTTHMYFTVAPPDIWNGGKTQYPALDNNSLSDIGGPALRFSMYKATALISKNISKIETFAGGGIVNPENVAEAIMLGANACQTLSGIVDGGIKFITNVNKWLEMYMGKCGYNRIEDFRGIALQYISGADKAEFYYYVANPDYSKCIGCGRCAESYCPAITMINDRPVVESRLCSSCGMCNCICPEDAFIYVPRN